MSYPSKTSLQFSKLRGSTLALHQRTVHFRKTLRSGGQVRSGRALARAMERRALGAFPLAPLIIACVRGFLLNFGVYHATRAAIGLPFVWSPAITFITIFVTTFATVIAITKDLPDIEGDLRYKIQTFSTRLGVKTVSYIGSGLLLANYIFAIALSVQNPTWFNQPLMVGFHALFALFLVAKTKRHVCHCVGSTSFGP